MTVALLICYLLLLIMYTFQPATEERGTPNPLQRLIRLPGTERREIAYIWCMPCL